MSCDHDFESVGHSEMIDTHTVAVEYECLNCGQTEYQYYEIEKEDEDE